MAAICAFSVACVCAEETGPKPPDRRELWVPMDKLGHVLDEKAVLLSREQYEALLRDAGQDRPVKPDAPVGAMISNASIRAVPVGKTVSIRAELSVTVLRDGWCEVPLDFPGTAFGEVKTKRRLDGEVVLVPRNAVLRTDAAPAKGKAQGGSKHPMSLLVRGLGEHRITIELTGLIASSAGVNAFTLTVPNVASGTFSLALPPGATMEKAEGAMKVSATAEATTASLALSPATRSVAFAWKNAAAANDAQVPMRAEAKVRYDVDAEKVAGNMVIRIESALGELPTSFELSLPPEMKVLAVHADELRGWAAAGGKVTVNFQDGTRKAVEIEVATEHPSLAGTGAATVALPLPLLSKVTRLHGLVFLAGTEDVVVKEIAGDAALRRVATAEDHGDREFFGAYEFSGRAAAPRVAVERALPRMETDLDTLVEFRTDAIFLTRTVTLREQKGRRFSTRITLPAAEELLDVRRMEDGNKESEPEWTQEAGVIRILWSDESLKPRVFRLRSRVEPEKWTQLPAEGTSFTLGDAKISDAAKVAGYIALIADPAFRIEAQAGEMLERRDGRSTPVRGDYAWFRRDAFDLKVKIARRPAEVLAALTGYVLPLEGVLDMHASMNYQFLGGGTRSVRIRVPKDLAQNFHFDGPQIAERAFADDVWTITFQKELTGAYALGITAQVPVAKQAGDGGDTAKSYSFAVKVPVIAPLDVVRASGLWAVEANTETEIRFDAAGMNEIDSLLAPQIPDYAARHRVIGVFGWLGADYALTLNGVRHAAAGMLTAVVDAMELNTVISTSGLHRHEVLYRLRASGVAYLDVALPAAAQLLSVAIDGVAVKPVADRPGSVRLPLPAKRDANTGVIASLVYETTGSAWERSGSLALAAPVIAKEFPVLRSSWRVWLPDGFSFSEIESNLPVREAQPEELLVRKIGRVSLGAFGTWGARREAFVATSRMMVSGQILQGDSAGVYSEELVNFFGTQIELLQSAEVSKRAHARVRALHPELPYEEVKLEVQQIPHASIFGLKAYSKTPAYAEAFLNACMDEYIATKKKMRVQNNESTTVVLQDTLVRLEKDMQTVENEMHEFQRANSTALMQKDSGKGAEFENFKAKVERTKSQYDRLLASLRSVDVQKGLDADTVSILERASPAKRTTIADESGEVAAVVGSAARVLEAQFPNAAAGKPQAGEQRGFDRQRGDEMPAPMAPTKSATAAIHRKLKSIIFPKIDFRDSTIREALDFVVAKSKSLDPDGEGVNIVLKLGDGAGTPTTPLTPPDPTRETRITLTLNNVPLIEVIKYITNLANLKYKVEPFAVTIVPVGTATEELYIKEWKVPPGLLSKAGTATGILPAPGGAPSDGASNAKDFLAASGVAFGQGTFATYSPVSNSLVVKGTQDQLDLIERIIEAAATDGNRPAPGTSAGGKQLDAGGTNAVALALPLDGSVFGRKTAGLLPVTLDLPKNGRALVVEGLYAPERLVMRYEDWWSRAKHLWLWFVGGGLAFYVFAGRRHWWRTLWAMLLLSAVPLCVSPAWIPVCNALLGGWLVGLVLNRIAAWCVFRVRKEVLA